MKLATTSQSPEGTLLQALGELASEASIEVASRQILSGTALSSLLPAGASVYVPFLPKAEFSETISACRELVRQGFKAVPHLPARAVESREQLRETLAALRGAGVEALLLIAGDRMTPAGPFRDTLAVLESGIIEAHGFRRLAVAGHPAGHPAADVVQLDHALREKIEYARTTGTTMWIVSQFAFGSAQIIAWLERLRGKEFELPVRVGVPGPASLKTLISYAGYCGVEASARLLARRPGAARLLARWTPDGLVSDLAQYRLTHPGSLLQGIHLYTFGGAAETGRWLRELRPGSGAGEHIRNSGAA